MISRILFIIVAFLIGFVGVAQQPNFTNINVEDGLPSSEVYYSLQDSEGFMWFATDQGVSKYDGHSFTNYDEGKGLADDIIFEIFEDVNHRIWFVGLTGRLSYYQNDGIKPYKFNHLIDKHFNYKKFRLPPGTLIAWQIAGIIIYFVDIIFSLISRFKSTLDDEKCQIVVVLMGYS